MDTAIVAAIIGVAGVVAGAFIQTFGAEFLRRLGRSKDQICLSGDWDASWTQTTPSQDDEVIRDLVTLDVSRNGQVQASGRTPTHSYKMEGWDSSFAVTLAYTGLDMELNLVGTVILKKELVGNKLIGCWSQISREGTIIGGETTWTKRTS